MKHEGIQVIGNGTSPRWVRGKVLPPAISRQGANTTMASRGGPSEMTWTPRIPVLGDRHSGMPLPSPAMHTQQTPTSQPLAWKEYGAHHHRDAAGDGAPVVDRGSRKRWLLELRPRTPSDPYRQLGRPLRHPSAPRTAGWGDHCAIPCSKPASTPVALPSRPRPWL